MDFDGFCPLWSDFGGYPVLVGAKSWQKFFGWRCTGKKDGDEWLGTVKDKINIYRLKIIKNSEKFVSRFWTMGFAMNSVQKGY